MSTTTNSSSRPEASVPGCWEDFESWVTTSEKPVWHRKQVIDKSNPRLGEPAAARAKVEELATVLTT